MAVLQGFVIRTQRSHFRGICLLLHHFKVCVLGLLWVPERISCVKMMDHLHQYNAINTMNDDPENQEHIPHQIRHQIKREIKCESIGIISEKQTQLAPSKEERKESLLNGKANSKNEMHFIVQDPIVDPVKGCTTYFIQCSPSVDIRRRYNDFLYFRECLKRRWPCLYIPPVPEKKLTGNKEQRLIETRRKMFKMYLNRLPPHMLRSSTAEEFLKNPSLDMEKYYATLPTPRFAELVRSYKELFNCVNFQTTKAEAELLSFANYLKQAEKEINFLRSTLTNLYEARNGFNLHLTSCLQTVLPSYEADVYKEYGGRGYSSEGYSSEGYSSEGYSSKTPLTTANPKYLPQNPFQNWMDCIHYEALELQAMQECLRDRDTLVGEVQRRHEEVLSHQAELAKLLSGRTTLKSLFSKGSKSEQIIAFQKSIPQEQTQLKQLRVFLSVVNAVILEQTIPEFRRSKRECYYQIMKEVSCEQMKYLSAYGNTMRTVIEAAK